MSLPIHLPTVLDPLLNSPRITTSARRLLRRRVRVSARERFIAAEEELIAAAVVAACCCWRICCISWSICCGVRTPLFGCVVVPAAVAGRRGLDRPARGLVVIVFVLGDLLRAAWATAGVGPHDVGSRISAWEFRFRCGRPSPRCIRSRRAGSKALPADRPGHSCRRCADLRPDRRRWMPLSLVRRWRMSRGWNVVRS